MGVMSDIAAAGSKWRPTAGQPNLWSGFERDPEVQLGRPLLDVDGSSSSRPSSVGRTSPSYGATQNAEPWVSEGSSSSARTSPERFRRDSLLNRVPEEVGINVENLNEAQGNEDDEEAEVAMDEEWELEERGLYKGSYKRLITLYTFVPLSSLVAFILLAVLPILVWPIESSPQPHPKYFPSPVPELLASISAWSVSHHIRVPLYSLFLFVTRTAMPTTILSTTFNVFIQDILRISALPLLLVRHQMVYPLPTLHDPAFHRVWWLALGWSLADVIVGILQGYEQIALYRDALVPEGRAQEFLRQWKDENFVSSPEEVGIVCPQTITSRDGLPRSGYASPSEIFPQSLVQEGASEGNGKQTSRGQQEFQLTDTAIRSVVERDFDELLALKAREDLEEVYGGPVIRIPVFVSCLQRINSIILSLGLMLLLSAAYLRSPLSFSDSMPQNRPLLTNQSFYITFPIVVVVHVCLSLLHTPLVLPRIGMHVAAYVGVLVGLGSLFTGLAMWGALS